MRKKGLEKDTHNSDAIPIPIFAFLVENGQKDPA